MYQEEMVIQGGKDDDQKVARKVSMSTNVSSPAWSEDPVWLSEKQPSRSWTKPSTSGANGVVPNPDYYDDGVSSVSLWHIFDMDQGVDVDAVYNL